MPDLERPRSTPSLLDAATTLVRRRRLIAANCGIVVLAAVLVSLLLPKWYKTSAVILPPEQSLDPLSTFGMLQMAATTANLPWFATASDVHGAVLQSRTLAEEIIDRFDLKRVYRTKTIEKTVRALEKHRWIRVTDEGLVRVTVEARDPGRAADMANAHIDILDRFNRETRMTEGRKTRIFVEARLAETENALERAERALQSYQKEHGAVELTEQTRALIDAAARIESEIRTLDIRLTTLRRFATEDNPEVRRLRTRKESLEIERGELLGGSDLAGAVLESEQTSPFPSLRTLPELGMEYVRLLRDVEIQNQIHSFLMQEFERSKILETRDTPTLQILDRASPPEKKSRPRRWLIVVVAGVAALVGSTVLAFGLDATAAWRQDPETRRRLESLTGALRDDWNALRGRIGSRPDARQ